MNGALTTSVGITDAQPKVGDHTRRYIARVATGEMGALPALTGLVLFSGVFALLRPTFLSASNLANLFTQGAAVVVIAMGLVFVMLLGEIDLSAGYTSGVCGAVLAVLAAHGRLPWYAAAALALLVALVIGLGLGLLVTKTRVPSFVVTLAALLGLQGVALLLIGDGTTVTVDDATILSIANGTVAPAVAWLMWAGGLGAYVMIEFRRKRKGLHHRRSADPAALVVWRILVAAVLSAAMVYLLNQERSPHPDIASLKGVPIVVPVVAVMIMLWTFVLRRTAYGRRIYTVGRGRQAAQQAGINVDRIRVSVFVICSCMAAVGGAIAVSRAHSVDANTGGVNVLLYAVAAAVFGGTSLFGGKGRVLDAVLGGALMAVIDNGMGLMGYSSGVKYIVTCAFLLLAACLDVVSRAREAASASASAPASAPVSASDFVPAARPPAWPAARTDTGPRHGPGAGAGSR
jgi:D-xylose transport system permease protein